MILEDIEVRNPDESVTLSDPMINSNAIPYS